MVLMVNFLSKRDSYFSHFLFAAFIAIAGGFLVLLYADQWEEIGDGVHYLSLYEKGIAASPFGYRILTPLMAKLLPWSAYVNFSVITLLSLTLIPGILSVLFKRAQKTDLFIFLITFLWVFSYPFIYYSSTIIRADGPMLMLLSLIFLIASTSSNALLVCAVIILGTLAHEMMLIALPLFFIDKVFPCKTLKCGQVYSWPELFFIALLTIGFFLSARQLISVLPGQVSYVNGLKSIYDHVMSNSGSLLMHGMRIYAAYGPLFFYSISGAFLLGRNESLNFGFILLVVAMLTVLAVDTLRVMSIIYIPVIYYAAEFLFFLYRKNMVIFITALLMQLIYSYFVFFHLRTFESNFNMKIFIVILSIFSLLICFRCNPLINNSVNINKA